MAKNKNKRKSLSKKVIVATLILAIISILGIYSNKSAMDIVADYVQIYDRYVNMLQLTEDAKTAYTESQMYISVAFFREGQEDAPVILGYVQNQSKIVLENCEKLNETVLGSRTIVENEKDEELIGIVTAWTAEMMNFARSASDVAQQGIDGNYMAVYAFGEAEKEMQLKVAECEKAYDEIIGQRVEKIQHRSAVKVSGTNVFNNILMFVNFAVAGILIFILYRNLIKPARASQAKTQDIVQKLQDGNGDLTERVPVRVNDEVGSLSNGINSVIEELHDIVSMMGGHATSLQEVAQNVADNIKNSEDEIANVSSTMEQMSASSQETSASLTQVSQEMDDISSLVEGVFAQAKEQSAASERIVTKVQQMREGALADRDRSDEETQKIVEALDVSIESARKVEKIHELVSDILSIAGQTNLLSLNASIEAARAGEAGKGFAVVADEISKLAKDSSDAASHIQEVSDEVIAAVNDLAKRANEMSQTLKDNNVEGRESAVQLTDSYQSDINGMAQSMEEFAESSERVQEAIVKIKDAISAINAAMDENAEGITNVTAATGDIALAMTDIQEDALKNLKVAEELYKEVRRFKI